MAQESQRDFVLLLSQGSATGQQERLTGVGLLPQDQLGDPQCLGKVIAAERRLGIREAEDGQPSGNVERRQSGRQDKDDSQDHGAPPSLAF